MKNYLLLAGLLLRFAAQAQGQDKMFHWPYAYQIRVPRTVFLQLKEQFQVKERWGIVPERFTQLPVFNVLYPKQRDFTDGLYYNIGSVHDTGRLFIYKNKRVTFLSNNSPEGIIADFNRFLQRNSLPEAAQVEYLRAIIAFLKFQRE